MSMAEFWYTNEEYVLAITITNDLHVQNVSYKNNKQGIRIRSLDGLIDTSFEINGDWTYKNYLIKTDKPEMVLLGSSKVLEEINLNNFSSKIITDSLIHPYSNYPTTNCFNFVNNKVYYVKTEINSSNNMAHVLGEVDLVTGKRTTYDLFDETLLTTSVANYGSINSTTSTLQLVVSSYSKQDYYNLYNNGSNVQEIETTLNFIEFDNQTQSLVKQRFPSFINDGIIRLGGICKRTNGYIVFGKYWKSNMTNNTKEQTPFYLLLNDEGELLTVQSLNAEFKDLLLYPNPATNVVQIKNAHTLLNENYEMYDMSGQLLTTAKVSVNGIEVADLPSGMYFIRLRNTSEMQSALFYKN
jgi:hypothetical protein